MIALIVRGLLLAGAAIASWLAAEDAPNFSTIQTVIAVLIAAAFVFAVAFWPQPWSDWLNRLNKPR